MEFYCIREATEGDLSKILSVYAQPSMDNGKVLSLDKAKEIFMSFEDYPNYKLYVVTIEEQVIGTFALLIMNNLGHMGRPSGVLEDVVVESSWQGKGVGKLMMKFAIERCREFGCYKLSLSSNLRRYDAHTFYEVCNFEKHGYSFLIEL